MQMSIGVRRATLRIADRLAGWPRRVAALLCLTLAALSALSERHDTAVATRPVVAAARNLSAGSVLHSADVRLVKWPARLVPGASFGTLAQVIGRHAGSAMTDGEPITAARLAGPGLAVGLSGAMVATTVTLADGAAMSLVHPGDVVDLISSTSSEDAPGKARVIARSVRVLAVLGGGAAAPADDAGSLVVAATPAAALAIVAAAGASTTIILRAPP